VIHYDVQPVANVADMYDKQNQGNKESESKDKRDKPRAGKYAQPSTIRGFTLGLRHRTFAVAVDKGGEFVPPPRTLRVRRRLATLAASSISRPADSRGSEARDEVGPTVAAHRLG
jgi:hypothetical protein